MDCSPRAQICSPRKRTSNRDRCFDRGMTAVVFERDVLESKCIDIAHCRIESQLWKRQWLAFELNRSLLKMIQIKVHVAKGMHESSYLESCDLRDHVREK